ncbi:peptidase [Algimonas ampicilliniresistens]|uniref:Peptidase n=1 Tax=Algimonas ampicilliniresistens TaxID=1298735 RepID=A0ABQ5V6P6_9PROT|nr:zinc-dependent metalloprotease [Algimonas ampicilliniresistens]GLQ22251.1 peptidase [Algimonas ampicilliniresistens]
MRYFFLGLTALLLTSCVAARDTNGSSDPLAGLDQRDGFLNLHVDTNDGRVLVRLPEPGEDGVALEAIHTARLTSGLGSNPVGLDRGWGDSGKIVIFRKRGGKVLLEQPNLRYRASPDNPLEERAVAESFAPSFLASFDIVSRDGGLVIDMTDFLTSDVLGLQQYLKDADQGSFSLKSDRTLIDTDNVFSFPDNAEFDVFFTLETSDPGREVATTAANGKTATLIQHHSFVRLPDDGYVPLLSDPRAAAIEEVHYNYSAALSAPIETRLARRYRLQKDADGNTIKPIVVYIDGGAPEPIRSALVEGAAWWGEAFTEAGYPDGYRVEILPDDVHPLDVRYTVVQWVHRQTRGWSYGGGVSDPRTGEMLKGHVNLGSLRVRQDRMIFEGLLGAEKTGSGDLDDPVQLALMRIRQLSAHEIGHSLGFMHNFAASSDDKASVMDYPAMDVRLVDGEPDLSNVYGVGIGDWDKVTADWLYGDHTPEARDAILDAAYARGLSYVADSDGRSSGTGHPDGSVWDNGTDAVATLRDVMAMRAYALDRFGPDNLPNGWAQSNLNAALVPIYLYHRYQTAAAAKSIGGVRFDYGLAGEAMAAEIVPPARQREALQAVLSTLDPAALDIPDTVLNRLTPRLGSFSFADSDRELFRASAYPAFDVVAAADTAADLTFDALLHPRRLSRLVEFHRRDASNLGIDELMVRTRNAVMGFPREGRQGEIANAVRARFAYALVELLSGDHPPAVKAAADLTLDRLRATLTLSNDRTDQWLADEIERMKAAPRSAKSLIPAPKLLPPGSPIGTAGFHVSGFHDK